ncbi:adenylate kinase [Diplonema papillatum]|nr:adenylate kinase [Diplonema papillatum]
MTAMQPLNLPESVVAYLRDKRVPDLMERLLHELIVNQPDDPLSFLAGVLSTPVVPKVMLCSPPAGGKATQSRMLVEKYNLVRISSSELLRTEVKNGTPIGKQAEPFMMKGEMVPDSIVNALVDQKLNGPEATKNGWLLEGYPRCKNQALALQMAGHIPQVFFFLDVPDAVVMERLEGRRIDPETGRVYHLAFDPPTDGDVLARLEQRPDDAKDRAKKRLANYHRNINEVEDCYRSCFFRVNADREKEEVFESLSYLLDSKFPGTAPPA